MKTRKKIFSIEELIKKDELSFEDFEKLRKLEDLYYKAKQKYTKKQPTPNILDGMVNEVMNTLLRDNKQPKIKKPINEEELSPSQKHALDYAKYMESINRF